jgi:hypothetical protein
MNDLVDHYRNWPGQRFAYDVEPCLHAVPWPLQSCVELVTPVGREEDPTARREYPFNTLGFLQRCLFGCTPFLGLTENTVRDVREHVPNPRERIKDCPERPSLFDERAGALSTYELICEYVVMTMWGDFSETRHQALQAQTSPKIYS